MPSGGTGSAATPEPLPLPLPLPAPALALSFLPHAATARTSIANSTTRFIAREHSASWCRATVDAMALEHVAQGQTRFLTPGVAPDPRGVLLGRFCLLTFPTLEGVVSWFRLYSHEASLDELLAGLEITRVRTPLQSREMVIRIPAVSSYACDRAARLTRLVGGAVYTGTAKHFVKYRDDRSPYGYDAVD